MQQTQHFDSRQTVCKNVDLTINKMYLYLMSKYEG